MPFFTQHSFDKLQIDYSIYDPIAVISYTDVDGKITPLQFKKELPDQSRVIIKIDGIRQTKDINGGILFSCVSTINGTRQIYDIVFFIEPMMWVVRK